MWYEREFSDYDDNLWYVYAGLNVPEKYDYRVEGKAFQRWIDNSWHNDSCPRFGYIVGAPYDESMDLDLFVDYKHIANSQDSESRADGTMSRFQLYNEYGARVIFRTDVWEEMLFFIKGYTDALTTACVALAEVDIPKAMLYKAELKPIMPYYMRVR
jgi:hypothetical protein